MALRVVFAVSLAAASMFGAPVAHGDIYTWTDANGRVNVSNISPPEGVRVTSVFREQPPTPAELQARRDAARNAEVQALNDRVRQLESEIDQTRRPVAPPLAYVPVPQPLPMMPQYPVDASPTPSMPQYVASAPPALPLNPWCDPMWLTCGNWLGPPLYSVPVVVVRSSNFRRFPPLHG